ncbi:MAG: flagellar M-ring protein FliF, partial [Novosphingobium sp.]
PLTVEETPFYEAPWFATVVRYAAAVLALILVLLLGVRPMIKALKRNNPENAGEHSEDAGPYLGQEAMAARNAAGMVERELLDEKLTLARRLVAEKPDSAITALRQMLNDEGNREPERATA